MKVIIAGTRTITNANLIEKAISESGFVITEIVSGGAAGVDRLGEMYADYHNIPIKAFRADWKKFGRTAEPRRNKQMAEYADALIAIWDGESRGTRNMIGEATFLGIKIYVMSVRLVT